MISSWPTDDLELLYTDHVTIIKHLVNLQCYLKEDEGSTAVGWRLLTAKESDQVSAYSIAFISLSV